MGRSEASFSHAENECRDCRRVRHFSADQLLALARCFDLPMVFFLVPPPGRRPAGAGLDDEGLDRQVMIDAVFGTAETLPVLEGRLLAWSVEHGRATGGTTPLPADLQARLRHLAEELFGRAGERTEAMAKAAPLLHELDTPAHA